MLQRKDILPDDYVKKENITNSLRKLLKDNNFKFIMPPICEHNSVYENSRYKDEKVNFIFNNEIITLRPDFTPSVSRMINTLKLIEGKIAYMGEVFRKSHDEITELTQCGAEFIGDEIKDGEAILLLVDCIKVCGITNYSIEISHSSIFRYIVESSQLDEVSAKELNKIVCTKSTNDVLKFSGAHKVPKNICKLLLFICNIENNFLHFENIIELINDAQLKDELIKLKATYEFLKSKNIDVNIDLGIVKDFDYYTGIVFEGYIENVSKAIASGGRYDNLIEFDNKRIKAVGFGINVDSLMKGENIHDYDITC